MDRERLIDMIGEINLEYLDECHERREQRRNRRKSVRKFGSVAASVVLVAVISLSVFSPTHTDPSPTLSDKPDHSPGVTVPTAIPGDGKIVFAGDRNMLENVEFESDWLLNPDSGKSLFFDVALNQALENAEDDTVFAFTVGLLGGEAAEQFPELVAAYSQAQQALVQAAEECVAELMAERGISEEEARARKFTHPKFLAAREAYQKAVSEYAAAWVPAAYNQNKAAFDALSELGFSVLYTAEDEEYIPYLYRKSAIGVMTATKAQLLELKDREMEYIYYLTAAAEHAAEVGYDDNFTAEEISLADDSKLTDDLITAFEQANGGSVKVLCKIAYFGKRYTDMGERQQAVYAALGTTADQYWSSGDDTGELWDRYHKANENILFHMDYNAEVVEKLLNDGELVEMQDRQSAFVAELTYERAMELCENKEIAYIRMVEDSGSRIGRDDLAQLDWKLSDS